MAWRKLSTVAVLGVSAVKNLRFAGGKGSAGVALACAAGAAGVAAGLAAVWAAAVAEHAKESTPAPRASSAVKPAKAEDLSLRVTVKIKNPAFRCRFPRAAPLLDLNFDRDGKPAPHPEGFAGDFENGSGLLPLVLTAFDELEDGTDEGDRNALVGGDLFGGAVALDVGLEDGIEDLVGRERVGVALVGAELGGGMLFEGGAGDDLAVAVGVVAEGVDLGLHDVAND